MSGGVFLGDEQRSTRAQIDIAAILGSFVIHFEVIGHGQAAAGSEPNKSIAVVAVGGEARGIQGGIEHAIGIEQEDVALAVGGHAGA